ncbi:MAG: DoxX family protein [Bacteroidota bacterium]
MNFPRLKTEPLPAILIIRIMVGAVFLSEGLQKFIYPAVRGAGRFEQIGFPTPEFLAGFVGVFEVICGVLILAGLLTRYATIPLILTMLTAIVITKIPIAFGESFEPFNLRELNQYGFWAMAHAIRTDFAMLLGSIFLLIKGGGKWSMDRLLMRKHMQ